MPASVITPAPVGRKSPEYRALLARAAAAPQPEVYTGPVRESKQAPGLTMQRQGRQVVVRFGRFDWRYLLLDGRAYEMEGPPFFRLSPRQLAAVESGLRALLERLDGVSAEAV